MLLIRWQAIDVVSSSNKLKKLVNSLTVWQLSGGSLRLFINSADEVRHEGKIKPVLTKLVRLDCGQNPVVNTTIRPAQSNFALIWDMTAVLEDQIQKRWIWENDWWLSFVFTLFKRNDDRWTCEPSSAHTGPWLFVLTYCCYWIHYKQYIQSSNEGEIKPVLTKLVRLDCGQNPVVRATRRPAQNNINIVPIREMTACKLVDLVSEILDVISQILEMSLASLYCWFYCNTI